MPDEVLVTTLGGSFLQRRSVAIRSVDDAHHALAIVASWRPHLVVFRNQLEAAAAAQFCRTLVTDAAPHGTKLLMITETLHDSDFSDLATAGAHAHLVSPVEPAQLLATIAEMLGLDQRKAERVAVEALVHTEGFDPEGAAVDATLSSALCVSEEGMLIESSRHLALEARGRVQFFLPGAHERLSVEARVRAAIDEVRLHYALEFTDLAPQYRAAIRRYVESQREAA